MTRVSVPLLLVAMATAAANASTSPALSFDELVARADAIFVGEVVDLRSFWTGPADRRLIMTRVVFSVAERLHGGGGGTEALDVLGGEVGGQRLQVAGAPVFVRGDRHVVFAYRRTMAIPVVGMTQGLLRVERDVIGADRVLTYERVPIGPIEGRSVLSTRRTPAGPALTLGQLRDRVRVALADAAAR